ncbi:MAG TPA: DoxX family protein [Tepidisphaeraceae bacterium]|jgi:uncharacterized membrane protein YphA (DoxX/SURF4 family)|nr:DoxX family protein [Tepidisphaeraceae bacterium]
MDSSIQTAPPSKAALWTGRILSAIPVLILLMSGVMKFLKLPAVVQGFEHLGYPAKLALLLGILEVGCTIIYLIPRTSILGAILLTGYLGGAIASHVRIGEYPNFVTIVILGILVWLGLYLRDPRLRALIPLRT